MARPYRMSGKQAEAPPPVPVRQPVAQLGPIPDYLKGTAGIGLENVDSSDMETPRLVLLQLTSGQVTNYEEARPGMYWHTMLNQPMGDKNGFTGVVVYVDKRAILWRNPAPVDTGGILARTDDLKTWKPSNAVFKDIKLPNGKVVTWDTSTSVARSGLLEWGSSDIEDKNSTPAGTLMINVVMAFPDYPGIPPAVFSFQRTGQPVGRRLLQRINISGVASYAILFRFGSELVDKGGLKFYIPSFEPISYVPPEQIDYYKSIHDALNSAGLRMREEQEEDGVINGESINSPEY